MKLNDIFDILLIESKTDDIIKNKIKEMISIGLDEDELDLTNFVTNYGEKYVKSIKNPHKSLNKFFDEVRKVEDLKNLARDRRIKTYKKKEIIYAEGSDPVYLYFLSKGKVKLYGSHEYGKELITTLHKEGEFFGYKSLLEGGHYTATAEALDDCEVCLIPKEDFLSLMYNNMAVMRIFVKMLTDNIKENEKQLINLAYSSVRKRVAEALLKLQERYKKEEELNFSIAISREDLANIVGTATESLIRTLGDFKEEKLIEIKGSAITILDATKLRKLKA
jgi:CRP-like cAMP-binding protein